MLVHGILGIRLPAEKDELGSDSQDGMDLFNDPRSVGLIFAVPTTHQGEIVTTAQSIFCDQVYSFLAAFLSKHLQGLTISRRMGWRCLLGGELAEVAGDV